MFPKLKYPLRPTYDSTIRCFIRSVIRSSQITQHEIQLDKPIRIVLPFKDEKSTDAVQRDLSDLSKKILRPVFDDIKEEGGKGIFVTP